MIMSESMPKLTSEGNNFLTWKKKLYTILNEKNIGHMLSADQDSGSEVDTQEWDHHADLTARDIIDKSIDNNLSIMYQDRSTAKCLMDALTVHFKTTLSRQVALQREYFHNKMPKNCSIGCHITKMGSAAAELEAAGIEISEMLKVVTLIDSLPNSWRDAVLARTDLNEDLTMEVVIERLRSIGDMRALKYPNNRVKNITIVGLVAVFFVMCVTS